MTHTSNFQRWFALGVESNAWSLVFLSCAVSSATILGVWLALTAFSVSSSQEGQRDVRDPVFAVFPVTASQHLYLWYSAEVFGRLGVALPPICFYLVIRRLPNHRLALVVDALVALLFVLLAALAVALVIAKRSADQQRLLVESRDSTVVASFNAYYCSARAVSLCADQTVSIQKLREVFAGESDDATKNVVRGCRYALSELYDSAMHHEAWLAIHHQRSFMSSCNTSDAVDTWCGEYILEKAASSDGVLARLNDAAQMDSTPASIHGARFHEFEVAWRTRFEFDAIMFSVVGAAMLVFCVAWTKMLETDKREWALPAQVADAKKNT